MIALVSLLLLLAVLAHHSAARDRDAWQRVARDALKRVARVEARRSASKRQARLPPASRPAEPNVGLLIDRPRNHVIEVMHWVTNRGAKA